MVDVVEAAYNPVALSKTMNVLVALNNQAVEANLEYVEEAAYKPVVLLQTVDVYVNVFPT